ncbi:MAG: hypothetical protein H0T65_23485 [Deltaproteobacteria bacterium]|nr:hypothetical protein [Deltaproteobacteria bacterium]
MPDAPVITPRCEVGPVITRTRFVDESTTYLRNAFGRTSGFEAGTVAYGEGWVSLGDGGCPLADWTTLAYVTTIDPKLVPPELRATHTHVAAVWALNGRRFVAYLAPVTGDAAPWWQGTMPDNAVAIAKASAPQAALDALVAKLSADHPTVTTTWLDAIGILTLETPIGNFAVDDPSFTPGRVSAIDAATADVRASGLFEPLEWSGFVVRIPHESFAAKAVESDEIGVECLRTHTKAQRDANAFSTTPSFAPPLGTGQVVNPNACK